MISGLSLIVSNMSVARSRYFGSRRGMSVEVFIDDGTRLGGVFSSRTGDGGVAAAPQQVLCRSMHRSMRIYA